ncbi:hypothetical protein LA080_005395 [Diaporthe eres]|nr:hypothetical protein LA080_005395 [Diaporthe eres]
MTSARIAPASVQVFRGSWLQLILIHSPQVILVHGMYMPTTSAAADAKHWGTLNWIYFDELQLIADIGAVNYGTDGV